MLKATTDYNTILERLRLIAEKCQSVELTYVFKDWNHRMQEEDIYTGQWILDIITGVEYGSIEEQDEDLEVLVDRAVLKAEEILTDPEGYVKRIKERAREVLSSADQSFL